jgi:hypothetical protein
MRVSNLEIQKWVVRTHGFVPEGPWIEHCKALAGLVSTPEAAANTVAQPQQGSAKIHGDKIDV